MANSSVHSMKGVNPYQWTPEGYVKQNWNTAIIIRKPGQMAETKLIKGKDR